MLLVTSPQDFNRSLLKGSVLPNKVRGITVHNYIVSNSQFFKEGGIPPLPQGLDLVRIIARYARKTLTGQAFLRNVEVSCRQNL